MSKRLGERMKCNICNELMKEETDYYICPYCSYALKRKIESKETQYKRYLAHKYDENYISYMKNLTREIDFNNNNMPYPNLGDEILPTLINVKA